MSDDHRLAAPFHAGELAAQSLAARSMGDAARPLPASVPIRARMPDQHRAFFAQLPFLCLAVPDADGWPLATLLEGRPGFAAAPDATRLTIAALPGADDPARGRIVPGSTAGLLGIDLATRRRNRANGRVAATDAGGFAVDVDQSFGNCPRYIQQRQLVTAARTPGPPTALGADLPPAARALIARCTTLFVASASGTQAGAAAGLDISHRGGPAGFVRQDGAVLSMPDYAGNGYFNTFGNFLAEPRAAIVLADFETGDVLQLQGRAEVEWKTPAERGWRFEIVRGVWRPGVFGLREIAVIPGIAGNDFPRRCNSVRNIC